MEEEAGEEEKEEEEVEDEEEDISKIGVHVSCCAIVIHEVQIGTSGKTIFF